MTAIAMYFGLLVAHIEMQSQAAATKPTATDSAPIYCDAPARSVTTIRR